MNSGSKSKTILLQNCSILSPQGQLLSNDLLIENGKIKEIDHCITEEADQVIDLKGKFVSPGLIDLHVHLRDPGQTHKEDIVTGTSAAAAGGFTHIASMPNTDPVTDNPQTVNLILKKSQKDGLVNVMPVAAITVGLKGEQLTNFKELKDHRVIALSDDGRGVQNDKMMAKAMERASALNMPILAHCENEEHLPHDTREAEISQIRRDLELAKKSSCHYHVCHISCKESLQIVREAKRDGIKVTCEVAPHHILLCAEDAPTLDTNYKMNPPLRSRQDLVAVREALLDGTIDIVATDHAPHSVTEKSRNYQDAPNGIIGMETAFPSLYTNLVLTKILTLNKLIDLMSLNCSKIFSIPNNAIKIGNRANLTVIDLDIERIVDSSKFLSKGRNTPFNGDKLTGWPIMTIIEGEIKWKM